MAKRNWTEAQRAAIETRGKTLLVSAAAGSGKTAALTERIIRRLTDKENPGDISRLLIVTFTRAAASELRERISAALSEALLEDPTSKHLSMQIVALGSAHISTIDSFCLDLVRSNFLEVGLPPKFRMADESELSLLSRTLIEEEIEKGYRSDPDFGHFSDHFSSVRSDRNLGEILLKLYTRLCSFPDGIEFLRKNAELLKADQNKSYFETAFGRASAAHTVDLLEYSIRIFREAMESFHGNPDLEKAYLGQFSADLATFEALYAAIQSGEYRLGREIALSYTPLRLGSLSAQKKTEESVLFQELRKELIAAFRKATGDLFILTEEEVGRAMRETAAVSQKLYTLLSSFDARYSAEKKARAMADFSDIRRYAYLLLRNPDRSESALALSLRARYDEIYIDEYQDVDRVQDLIFSAIAEENGRFLVGDIKQSIYAFRGAEPAIFGEYRNRFPLYHTRAGENAPAVTVSMSNNFRCDPPIIDFTNLISNAVFPAAGERLAYSAEEDALISSKALPEGYTPEPVELLLLVKPEEESEGEKEEEESSEADLVAEKISSLLSSGTKKQDGSPLLPKDIAVLARTKSTLKEIGRALDARGIAYSSQVEADFFENPDVLLLLSLLNVIDNPRRDIYLAGTLRSPLYGYTLEELIEIRDESDASLSLYDALLAYREAHPESEIGIRAAQFLSELTRYRSLAENVTVDTLLREIYRNPKLLASGSLYDNPHLLTLYEYARKFEAGAFRGLYQFIAYVTRLMEEGTTIETSAGITDANAVSLLTIHQSKGLEFPTVVLSGAGKSFHLSDAKESLLLSEELGAAMRLSDRSGFGRIRSPLRDAIAAQIQDRAIEEEMRVLYVALTRAREKLLITAKTKRTEEALRSKAMGRAAHPSRYNVMSARSYLDWILYAMACAGNTAEEYTAVKIYKEVPDCLGAPNTEEEEAPPPPTQEAIEQKKAELRKQLDTVYPDSHLSRLPAKLSVSRLFPDLLEEGEGFFPEKEEPLSKEQEEAAKRGSATHAFLQFCDFKKTGEEGVEKELARLVEKRFLSPDMAELIFREELSDFFQSALFAEIQTAQKVYREQRFNLFLPATLFAESEETRLLFAGEEILVQGVIDLFFLDKDGRLVLVDYKTDRITRRERESDFLLGKKLLSRHGQQLSYYALALEKLLGKRPDRILIYATAAGRTIACPV